MKIRLDENARLLHRLFVPTKLDEMLALPRRRDDPSDTPGTIERLLLAELVQMRRIDADDRVILRVAEAVAALHSCLLRPPRTEAGRYELELTKAGQAYLDGATHQSFVIQHTRRSKRGRNG